MCMQIALTNCLNEAGSLHDLDRPRSVDDREKTLYDDEIHPDIVVIELA